MKIKPSLPKGLRDFLPKEVLKRQYIINTIRNVFELYGFQGIETPVMENLETLTGKYGEEGDKLLFKVLNNGDFLSKVDENAFQKKDSRALTPQISKRGLRYDLTVPLARYVVQNQNDLTFPFKRYHIAPVWRADRPQKGRYQEFYQCDVDVIGSESLYNDVELVQIYSRVFSELNLDVEIQYNNRKVLVAFMQAIGLAGKETLGITILDKLDKIGIEKVANELKALEITDEQVELFKNVVENNNISLIPSSELLENGKEEVEFIQSFNIQNAVYKISLARGLDYYTGSIFEVVSKEYEIGSIGGGGRYDNLTEMFGKNDLTGVGVSFGLERIFDVMQALNKFPEDLNVSSKLLFVHFSKENQAYAFKAVNELRNNGIASEVYPDNVKFPKQMKYANDKNIPFVAIVGDNEMNNNTFMLKNMETGIQEAISLNELISNF